jgi:hypothetical protein
MKETSFKKTLLLAWKKSQSLFFPYLILHIVSGLCMLSVVVVSGLIVFPFIVTKNMAVFVPLAIIMGAIALGALIFISSWSTLIATHLLKNSSASLKTLASETKKDVGRLVKTNILIALFFVGLLPLGIVSAFVVYILWSLWASMIALSFVYEERSGLDALWGSKGHVQKRFWQVVGLLALSTGTSMLVNTLFQQFDVPLRGVLTNLIGVFLSVFVLCGLYELFIQAPKSASVRKPAGWMLASKLGYIVLLLIIVLGFSTGRQQWGSIQKMIQRDIPLEIDRTIERL